LHIPLLHIPLLQELVHIPLLQELVHIPLLQELVSGGGEQEPHCITQTGDKNRKEAEGGHGRRFSRKIASGRWLLP